MVNNGIPSSILISQRLRYCFLTQIYCDKWKLNPTSNLIPTSHPTTPFLRQAHTYVRNYSKFHELWFMEDCSFRKYSTQTRFISFLHHIFSFRTILSSAVLCRLLLYYSFLLYYIILYELSIKKVKQKGPIICWFGQQSLKFTVEDQSRFLNVWLSHKTSNIFRRSCVFL